MLGGNGRRKFTNRALPKISQLPRRSNGSANTLEGHQPLMIHLIPVRDFGIQRFDVHRSNERKHRSSPTGQHSVILCREKSLTLKRILNQVVFVLKSCLVLIDDIRCGAEAVRWICFKVVREVIPRSVGRSINGVRFLSR